MWNHYIEQIEVCCHLQAALNYSSNQVADLLALRHLFFTRHVQLAKDRTAMLDQPKQKAGKASEVKACTQGLHALVAETYHTSLQFGTALYLGVTITAHHAPSAWHQGLLAACD